MSRHGFARDHEFTLPEQTDDSIASELQEPQATLDCCPFPFSLQVCRRIMKNGFSAAFRAENTGCQPMPFCIGARTAFRCPPRTGGRFEDYAVVFDDPQTASMRLLSRDVRMEFSGFPMSAFWTNGDTEAPLCLSGTLARMCRMDQQNRQFHRQTRVYCSLFR